MRNFTSLIRRRSLWSAAGVMMVLLGAASTTQAQIANSAYRVLGQPNFRQNGVNLVQGAELFAPSGVAVDPRPGTPRLYVADTNNNRILGWPDVRSFQNGEAATLFLGQLSPQNTIPLGIGIKGVVTPVGMAVNPITGDLYVADYNDHRILRYPNPFANPTRVEPDAVYGQPNFSGRNPNSTGVNGHAFWFPRAVAFDRAGNLFVSDSANSRVLRFSAASLNQVNPDADLVLGQLDFTSSTPNHGAAPSSSGFDNPAGLAFDQDGNLYVSDFRNARVLKFTPPFANGGGASGVLGQPNFTTTGVPSQRTASTIGGPAGLAVGPNGKVYISTPPDNRILVWDLNSNTATDVIGQSDFTSVAANGTAAPRSSSGSLSGVSDVKLDNDGNLVVADTNNNRVLFFPTGSKSASRLLGQQDFSMNGANQTKPVSINAAFKMVIDYSRSPYPLYVSDTANNRVLIWRNMTTFQNGTPADAVIGQPDLYTALPNFSGRGLSPTRTSLNGPRGIAVDSQGNLYVADAGNNRVLRFPRPVDQSDTITPDLVLGQTDFTSNVSASVLGSTLNTPSGVAVGPRGTIFVADTLNNRVLEFPGDSTSATRVYGQPTFNSNTAPSARTAQSLSSPLGIAVDQANNLYVADGSNNRVLIFSQTQNAPSTGASASVVLGQNGFNVANAATGNAGLWAPYDVALDSSGQIYVSDSNNNRVVVFPSLLFLPLSGATSIGVIGQQDVNANNRNYNSPDGLATPEGLYGPAGVFVDRRDTVYVGDAGNNRVVQYLLPVATVNAAHFLLGVPVPTGGHATLFSAKLTDKTEAASVVPLTTTLAGIQVTINDSLAAPLLYASPGQINFQVPSASPLGNQRVAVRTADTNELLAGGTVAIASSSPGLYAVVNQDGTRNSASAAAPRGSIITVYGNGQGPVAPSVPDGQPAPSSPLSYTQATPTSDGVACVTQQSLVCAAVGSTFGDISYSGLAPGFIGLWQLNVKIPTNALTGNVPLRIVLNGSPSNIITIAIR